jgi:outer membrane lipoprotein-sorting protein
MKKTLPIIALLALAAALLLGSSVASALARSAASHSLKPKQAVPSTTTAQSSAGAEDLKSFLAEMDKAAATFKSAQADFDWDQYQRVVDEHDVQKGEIYFRKNKSSIDAAVKIVSPEPKQVLFKDGKLSLYQPKIDQVTEYKAGQNRADVESFMSLGFGASGTDLAKNFEIKLQGWDTVDGVRTAKLDLIPKQEKVKSSLSHVLLWMDSKRNVSIKQQFFEPSGDYRLTHYTNIKVNDRVPDDVFRLKTTSSTKVVRPQ